MLSLLHLYGHERSNRNNPLSKGITLIMLIINLLSKHLRFFGLTSSLLAKTQVHLDLVASSSKTCISLVPPQKLPSTRTWSWASSLLLAPQVTLGESLELGNYFWPCSNMAPTTREFVKTLIVGGQGGGGVYGNLFLLVKLKYEKCEIEVILRLRFNHWDSKNVNIKAARSSHSAPKII